MQGINKSTTQLSDGVVALNNVFSTKVCSYLKRLDSAGDYQITRFQYRPDMISWELYKRYDYDWILMLFNGITTEEFHKGRIIQYPSATDINNYLLQYQ